jgi:HTH-type transcriptional regulator / antitoxin HigA
MSDAVHPGRRLKQMLEERGWSQDEFARVIGRRRQTVSSLIAGRAGVTPEMAIVLGAALGNQPTEWLRWSLEYDLSAVASTDGADVQRRARLYSLAPIREMLKRGWIQSQDDDNELEKELARFFGSSLESEIVFSVAAKRTETLASLNSSEKAWCFRARQLAQSVLVKEYEPSKLDIAEQQLRKAAAYPREATRVSRILSEFGIRFVVIEPLPGAKIDGAAFWLDDTSPVIALSLRFDRLDAFWFTLFHEFAHIQQGDGLSVDINFFHDDGGVAIELAGDSQEQRANAKAADILVPQAEMESFIRRLAPLYSSERIVQFAHKVKIHPGIIVGQLQYRHEIGYHALREFLVKIRSVVIQTALTDGWGLTISPQLI